MNEEIAEQRIVQLPKIELVWVEGTQEVEIKFKATEFKTWDFVLGILAMAKLKAEHMRQMSIMAAMQNQAMQQGMAIQHAERIKRRILPS